MRMSGPAFDTAHMLRPLLLVFSALALVGLIALAVGRLARLAADSAEQGQAVVACLQKLGYSTSVYHDDGREPSLFGTFQARPPSDDVTVTLSNGNVAGVTVPDDSGPVGIFDFRDQLKAAERAAISDCAN